MAKKIYKKSSLPTKGCRASVNIVKGPKLMVQNTCKVPGVVKVDGVGKVVKRVSLPAPVRAECKGTRGKERKNCIKTARAKLKLEKHTAKVAKYEELGKEVPARLYEKGEKLQARYNIAGELYEIS